MESMPVWGASEGSRVGPSGEVSRVLVAMPLSAGPTATVGPGRCCELDLPDGTLASSSPSRFRGLREDASLQRKAGKPGRRTR